MALNETEAHMAEARRGDTVRVHYTGTLDDGTVFDSSRDREPLEFSLGTGQVIPGFDQALTGMKPGESKKVTIPAAEAYGPYRSELVLVVDRGEFPPDIQPGIGDQFQLSQDGQSFVVSVTDVNDANVTLDANHPLAGEDLTFELELVEIV